MILWHYAIPAALLCFASGLGTGILLVLFARQVTTQE
jgi:hypothetical protein